MFPLPRIGAAPVSQTQSDDCADPLSFLGSVVHAAENAAVDVFHGVSDFAATVGNGLQHLLDPGAGSTPVVPPTDTDPKPPSAPTVIGVANFPYINQLRPSGADARYVNAPENCGPAVMSMIARHYDYGSGKTDAQLIEELMQVGQTDSKGTTSIGELQIADYLSQQVGLHHAIRGPAAGRDWDFGWIDSHLAAGRQLVANGDYASEPGHGGAPSGHWILICGKDSNGNYQIRDPLDPTETTLTPDELSKFVHAQPVDHGVIIAIGR